MKKNKLPKKESPFKVPEGYFGNLENRILDAVSETPALDSAEQNEVPFKVPDQYFERFDSRLNEKLEQEKEPAKVIPLFRKESYYYVAGIAAVLIAFFFTEIYQPQQNEITVDSIEMVALESYLNETIEFAPTDVLHVFDEKEFAPPQEGPVFDQEAVLEYLNENIEETAIIFNEN